MLAASLIVGLIWFLSWRRTQTGQPDQIKSLAVLPLENLSGDPAQEYFADGMTEALISNLSQVRALRVISRTSVMRFKGIRKPLAEIARELNVDAVIEGSVQRAGGRVKITARLIQAVNETPLRSFDYEGELADVLKLQSEVASAVAGEIRTRVTAEERERLASARRVNPDAHEAYLLGRYHLRRQNEADLNSALVTSSAPFSLIKVMRHRGQDFRLPGCNAAYGEPCRFGKSKLPRGKPRFGRLNWIPAARRRTRPWRWSSIATNGTGRVRNGISDDPWSLIRATSRRTGSLLSC